MAKGAFRLIAVALALGLVLTAFPVRVFAPECLKRHGTAPCSMCEPAAKAQTQVQVPACCGKAAKPIQKAHRCRCTFRAVDDPATTSSIPAIAPSFDFPAVAPVSLEAIPPAAGVFAARFDSSDSSPPNGPPLPALGPRAPPRLSE